MHPLNVYSHNEFADILARHNGWQLWNGSTYADGEAALLDFLGGIGVGTSSLEFYDGSGLSHSNRVTAPQHRRDARRHGPAARG